MVEHDAAAVEHPHRVPAMFVDRDAGDLDVGRAIGPLPDMKHPDPLTAQDRHLIHSCSDQANVLLAVNGHILGIGAGPDEHGVALLCGIHRFLNG
jgi:hypothetical protein